MTWQLFDTDINGLPSQVLLDDSFSKERPSDDLPSLARLRVECQQTPEGGYWHPDESSTLDQIENDLLGLAHQFGHGWAVYVRRVDSPGLREYDFYFGGDADLQGRTVTEGLTPRLPYSVGVLNRSGVAAIRFLASGDGSRLIFDCSGGTAIHCE